MPPASTPASRARGMTQPQIDACLANRPGIERLAAISQHANELGVHGTPIFFINGRSVGTQDWARGSSHADGRLSGKRGGRGRATVKVRRLKLSGFKSFVEPAELRVEEGLTGIVGPNGCGKSNVLEAIRWVMGESSPKSMRGAGMDDVIFAGTAMRPARDFAEVSLLVERDGRRRRRRAATARSPGGSSAAPAQPIGSTAATSGRKTSPLLFADAATGAHSPALVSQGKISAVIAAKPTERRLLLEEAAGIAGLHVRRKDAEQKFRATEANLIRLDEILAEWRFAGGAEAAGACRRALPQAFRPDPVAEARLIFARWREAAACCGGRDGGSPRGGRRGRAHSAGDRRGAGARMSAQAQRSRPSAARSRSCASRATRWRTSWPTARARRDTVARRLAELDRLDASLTARHRARGRR